ncbi:MAG: VC0807 family protein [Solirubrobacteraceae bacterium]
MPPRSPGACAGDDRRQRIAKSRRAALAALGPVVIYLLLRQIVGKDTEALAITAALPTTWVVIMFLWRRQVEWIGVLVVAIFLVVMVLTVVSGGSSLPLKLRNAGFAGVLGLICVISVLVRRPLAILLLQIRARRDPELADGLARMSHNKPLFRTLAVITALVGITLLVSAAVQTILALTLSTTEFVGSTPVVRWIIYAAGAVPIVWYVRRHPLRRAPEPGDDRSGPPVPTTPPAGAS